MGLHARTAHDVPLGQAAGQFCLRPMAFPDATRVSLDGFTEEGSAFALAVDEASDTLLPATLAVEADGDTNLGRAGTLRSFVRVGATVHDNHNWTNSAAHDALMEGFALSGEVERTTALARAEAARGHGLHVLWLDVPIERCVRNVAARRRAGRGALATACEALERGEAKVERLDTDAALCRTLVLLGLDPARGDRLHRSPPVSPPFRLFAAHAGVSALTPVMIEPRPCYQGQFA